MQIAIEDRFIVVRFDPLLASQGCFSFLRKVISHSFPGYTLLCDCRSVSNLTEEIANGIADIGEAEITLICCSKDAERVIGSWRWGMSAHDDWRVLTETGIDLAAPISGEEQLRRQSHANEAWSREHILTVRANQAVLHYRKMNPEVFVEHRYWDDEHYEDKYELPPKVSDASTAIREAIQSSATNSLLTEYVVQLSSESALLTPYHARALHTIEAGDGLLIGRPGIIARKTGMILRHELHKFHSLIANVNVRESEIQEYLEDTPTILKALGFVNVYPQVILQRDDGTSLRPDFIVEPTTREWCDIVDIKLPTARSVVGSRDRKTLAAAIHELVAQLREYAAYFENEKWARRIEQLYGIKCYKPRLVGIIGTDPSLQDDRQLRRLMTAYSDVDVITFDQLLKHAKTRLLI